MAAPKQRRRRGVADLRDALGVETGEAAQLSRRVIIDDEHVDGAVAARLQLKASMRFENRAEQRGKRHRLAEESRDLRRIGVMIEDGIDDGAEARDAAAQVKRLDREGQYPVILGIKRRRAARRRIAALRHQTCPGARHQHNTPFWACSRFSASSKTTDCGPSITSAATSSPRCAGRQCMKSACFAAAPISFAST